MEKITGIEMVLLTPVNRWKVSIYRGASVEDHYCYHLHQATDIVKEAYRVVIESPDFRF
jgi:hypothetical protein